MCTFVKALSLATAIPAEPEVEIIHDFVDVNLKLYEDTDRTPDGVRQVTAVGSRPNRFRGDPQNHQREPQGGLGASVAACEALDNLIRRRG